MAKQGAVQIKRVVTVAECKWLDRDLAIGEKFYIYFGVTYGCIGVGGVAVTEKPGETPFFEVPLDALESPDG